MSIYQQIFDYAYQLTLNTLESHYITLETMHASEQLKAALANPADMDSFLLVTCRNKSYDYLKYGHKNSSL